MSTQAANRSTQEVSNRPMPRMYDGQREHAPAPGTETKLSFLTTEFWIYLAGVVGVLAAAQLVGRDSAGIDTFRANQAWFFITLLTIAYMGSRGLAKAGSAWRSHKERSEDH